VSPELHAEDVAALVAARDDEAPRTRVSAPGTAWWPAMGEVPTLLPPSLWPPRRPRLATSYLPRVAAATAAKKLAGADILSWHFYPALSDRSALAKFWPLAPPIGLAAAAIALVAAAAAMTVLQAPPSAEQLAPLSGYAWCGAAADAPTAACEMGGAIGCAHFAAAEALACNSHAAAAPDGGLGPASAPTLRAAAVSAALSVSSALVALLCYAVWRLVVPIDQSTLRRPAVLDNCRQWARRVAAAAAVQRGNGQPGGLQQGGLQQKEPLQQGEGVQRGGGAAAGPACWLGETGSAQVGGQPGVSGTWAATVWWLDQLGLLALEGQEVQCRQTLAGADYGLLLEGGLAPTPDYWASLLWRRAMGTRAYAVALSADAPLTLRVYCHSTRRGGIGGGAGGGAGEQQGRTFLVINLGRRAVTLRLQGCCESAAASAAAPANAPHRAARSPAPSRRQVPGPAAGGASQAGGPWAPEAEAATCRVVEEWLLDAPSLNSRTVTINGSAPVARPDGSIAAFRKAGRASAANGEVSVPPGAALFAVVACAP